MRCPSVRIGAVLVVAGVLVGSVLDGSAQAAPTHGPGAVHDLHAVSHSSTTVYLSWTLPHAAALRHTVVRVSSGTHAPRSLHAGRRVVTGGRHRHQFTVTGLRSGRPYAFSVFALDAAGHAGRRVSTTVTVAPAPARGVRTFAQPGSTAVVWSNSRTPSFRRVVVRLARGAVAPSGPRRGHAIRLTGSRPTSATVPGLTRDTAYAVSVFAFDANGGYSSAAVTRFTTSAGPDADGTVTGLVQDAAKHPLTGVLVDLETFDPGGVNTSTRTDPDGRYSVSVPAGRYGLSVDGGVATGGTADAVGYQGDFVPIDVHSGRVRHQPVTRLRPGGLLRGRVLDSAGRPVAGAHPYVAPVVPYIQQDNTAISYSFENGPSTDTPTASDGTFQLRGVYTGAPLKVCAQPTGSGHALACARRTLLLRPGDTTTLPDLVLPKATGGTVAGTVRAPGRAVVSGAQVELRDTHLGRDIFVPALTDSAGAFSADDVPPGLYRACASSATASRTHPGGLAPACSPHALTVSAGHRVTLDVSLPNGAALTGTVRGPTGHPVSEAAVEVDGSGTSGYTQTDAHGQYTVVGLLARPVQVCVDTSGADAVGVAQGVQSRCTPRAHLLRTTAGRVRSGADLRLARGGAVTGTITDGSGRPAPYAFVSVNRAGDDDDLSGSYTTADAAGRYSIKGLSKGRYTVCADTADGDDDGSAAPPCHRGSAVVRIGRTTTHVDVRLPVTSAIRVTVRDSAGLPVAGADAAVLQSCPDGCDPEPLFGRGGVSVVRSDDTDAGGSVLLQGLAPGRYAVCLFAFDATTVSGGSPTGYADTCTGSKFTVVVSRGRTTAVPLSLPDGGAVSGRLTDTAGRPLSRAHVLVSQSAATDYAQDGFFDDDPDDPDNSALDDGDLGTISSPQSDGISAADGTYTVIGVRPGARTVCVDE